jgi:four helix bundle protein
LSDYSYRDLKVWQKAIELAEQVYSISKAFPREEQYGLTSQMRRCAVSIAANIAEGYGRDSDGSFVQFLRVSQGSVKELETLVIIGQRVGVVDQAAAYSLLSASDEIGRMLRALISTVGARVLK